MYRKKLVLACGCLLLTAVALVSGTLAWLSKSQSADGAFTVLSDFEVTGTLSFKGGAVYKGESILAPVSFVPDNENYIGHMKYVVHYKGASPAYIRVRVLEQWTSLNTNEISPASFLAYAMAPGGEPVAPVLPSEKPFIPAAGPGASTAALAREGKWVDNRMADYCYYYDVPVQPKNLDATTNEPATLVVGDGEVTLTLFDQKGNGDLVSGIDPTATQMGLVIEVEAVQPNRYREFWGITALPF